VSGPDRDRTGCLRHAMATLYQVSYGPPRTGTEISRAYPGGDGPSGVCGLVSSVGVELADPPEGSLPRRRRRRLRLRLGAASRSTLPVAATRGAAGARSLFGAPGVGLESGEWPLVSAAAGGRSGRASLSSATLIVMRYS
jgi:hypothetical protein